MARGSVSRRVARAAATGGSKSGRGRGPFLWQLSVVAIVVLGLASVAWSRYERTNPSTSQPTGAPTTSDHWRAAFAFDICGVSQPNPPRSPNQAASFTTKGDGLVYINPKSSADTGSGATLSKFVSSYPGMVLNSTSVRYPGQRTYVNGDKCGSQPGVVQVKTWTSLADTTGRLVSGDPGSLQFQNGQLITIAFLPKGQSPHQPASAAALSQAPPTSSTTAGGTSGSTQVTVPPKSPTTPPSNKAPPTTAHP